MASRKEAFETVAFSNQPYVTTRRHPELAHHWALLTKMGKLIEVWPGAFALPKNEKAAKKQIGEIAGYIEESRPRTEPQPYDYEGLILSRQEAWEAA